VRKSYLCRLVILMAVVWYVTLLQTSSDMALVHVLCVVLMLVSHGKNSVTMSYRIFLYR